MCGTVFQERLELSVSHPMCPSDFMTSTFLSLTGSRLGSVPLNSDGVMSMAEESYMTSEARS